MDPEKKIEEQKPQSQQQVQQTQQMTPELAAQLIQLFRDPKVEVKYGTMNAVLQYTKLDSSKLLFLQTDFFKHVIECIRIPQLHKISLSTLIHFSSNESCAQKLVDFVQPIVIDLRTAQGLPEQLGLLFLLNVSKQYEFTAKLLDKNQKQQQSQLSTIILEILFSFLQSKPTKRWVIANIFVNISSHTVGRQYIAIQKLYLTFLKYINDEKQSLRLAVLRILRNICFLWQQQQIVTQLLKKQDHLIDNLAIHILIMIIKSKLVQDWQNAVNILKQQQYSNVLDYDMEIQPDLHKINTTKQKSINQIQICIDAIIILSNADFPKRKPQFSKELLKKVIAIVNFTDISEQAKDKLQALQTFCFW